MANITGGVARWSRQLTLAALFACSSATLAEAGPTLESVKARGYLKCGVDAPHMGFTAIDETGKWSGFDVDFCRAIAAAVLGEADRVRYVPTDNKTRFTTLRDGEIDVLIYTTTWTLSREAELGFLFPAVYFYDGQGFMVSRDSGIKTLADLKGKTACTLRGTTTAANLVDYDKIHNLGLKVEAFDAGEVLKESFYSGRCDVFTDDASSLHSERASSALKPQDYVILPQLISKEPLGPAVRDDDVNWFKIVRWVVMATQEAEEYRLTQANVDAKRSDADPAIRRLLGTDPGLGNGLSLDDGWAYRIIRQVGNYGEIFNRNVGPETPLGFERGANELWINGGLIYPMPLR